MNWLTYRDFPPVIQAENPLNSLLRSAGITFLSVLLLVCVMARTGGADRDDIPCSDVAAADLRNARIGTLNLVNGKTCTSDGLPDKCDWEHTMVKDEILKPAPEKEVRLIVINANHLTGSGAWDTVLVFDCFHGNLKKIFENRYLYGVKTEKDTDGQLIFTYRERQPGDAMCCPSGEKKEIYRWNPDKNTYIPESTRARPRHKNASDPDPGECRHHFGRRGF